MIRPLGIGEALLHSGLWQGVWLWLVWAAGRGSTALPLLVTAVVLAAAAWRAGPAWWRLLALMAVGVACGVAVDGSLAAWRLVAYGPGDAGALPLWILALWALFAAALVLPLRRVFGRPLVAGLASLVSAPLAYLGAQALGAVSFPAGGRPGLLAVGLAYALATPVIVLTANRLLPQKVG